MRKNGRHPTPSGRARPRPTLPYGYRPLSLVLAPAVATVPETESRSRPPQGTNPQDRWLRVVPPTEQSPSDQPSPDQPSPDQPSQDQPSQDQSPPDRSSRDAHPAGGLSRDADPAGRSRDSDESFTPEQAQARAQEIADLAARRGWNRPADPAGRPDPYKSLGSPPGPVYRDERYTSMGGEFDAVRDSVRGINQMFLDSLTERWGGPEALDQLDHEPLPDEPFDWSAVPAEHRDRVGQVLALVDETCDLWFDVEHRTACRRLLARVAAEPWVVARRGKVQTIAGAIVWTIASFNGTTGRRRSRGMIPASWFAGTLGLSSGSAFATRSIDIRIAAGIHLHRNGPEPVGEPGLIISKRRRNAVWRRERLRRGAA